VTTKVVITNTTAAIVLPTPRSPISLSQRILDAYRHRWRPRIRGCRVTRKVCSGGGQEHPYPVNVR
jgi:hypothetical protein